jgi:predicted dehydrogenase
MKLGIVGCGFVADFYVRTLPNHPNLEIVGVMDANSERAKKFSSHFSLPLYHTLEDLLQTSGAKLILNLTNPRSHYVVSKSCLEAGKHVYSEKPLSMDYEEARHLVELAEKQGLSLSSAPCNVLSESAQTVWKALRDKVVGPVRLVYAEMDDGLIHKMNYQNWIGESGAPWPSIDEFEVGCTLEHAGYYVTWLVAFFGQVKTVTSFASCQIPDKETSGTVKHMAPDFSVACLQFSSGVVARLTCSIIAPHDHHLKIFGDDGILSIEDCWNYGSPVHLTQKLFRRVSWTRKLPFVKKANFKHCYKGSHRADVCRGVAEMVSAIEENRDGRLSARFALHVNEVVLAIQNPDVIRTPYQVKSTIPPMEPMPWAMS